MAHKKCAIVQLNTMPRTIRIDGKPAAHVCDEEIDNGVLDAFACGGARQVLVKVGVVALADACARKTLTVAVWMMGNSRRIRLKNVRV